MDISFKIVTLDELPLLKEIGYETFKETFEHTNTPSNMNAYLEKAFNLEKLKQELSNPYSTFYFMYSEGNLAGYLKLNIENAQTEWAAYNSLEIERIYLKKEYQGKGYGKMLLNKGLETAKTMGKTFVWLGVWEKNIAAIAFYKKMGFTESSTHAFYMGDEKQMDYMMRKELSLVRIEPWADADLALLHRTNAPEMMNHLGGPESEEQILARHKRYVEIGGTGTGRMFSIVLLPEQEAVGSIGYWERVWQEETVYEIGWGVLPPFQGRGIAAEAAAAAIASACAEHKHRHIHAFPSVDNPASNAICRKLGFVFIAECDFEYPPGSVMRCNDWRLDLTKPT